MRMKNVITLAILVIIVFALSLIGTAEINTSIADTEILNSNGASNPTETDNHDSTRATLTITMHTRPEE